MVGNRTGPPENEAARLSRDGEARPKRFNGNSPDYIPDAGVGVSRSPRPRAGMTAERCASRPNRACGCCTFGPP